MTISRRNIVSRAAKGSLLLLSFELGGATVLLTPQQARAQQVRLRQLTPAQAGALQILGDALLPGATEAGLVEFIDHQLGVEPNDCLLIAKYFQVVPPYVSFYAAGLSTVAALAERNTGFALAELEAAELEGLVREISNPAMVADGFPVGLFYLCLRSDAVDVVYGTPDGFKRLNVPYMEHILPPEGWNG